MVRISALIASCSVVILLTVTSAQAQLYPQADRVGIYFDTSAMTNWMALPEYQISTAYLILSNPSGSGSYIDAFECCVNLPAHAYWFGTQLPPTSVNITTFPNLCVGLAVPLPRTTVVVLATITFWTSTTSPGAWTVTPRQDMPPILTDAMCFNMIVAGNPQLYRMEASHVPAAVTNPDLSVVVDPQPPEARGAWHLSGPSGYLGSARGDTILTGLPFGSYTVTWDTTGVWAPPTLRVSTRTHDQWSGACIFSGTYRQRSEVVVSVQPAGLAAPWFLVGPDGFWLQGAGDRTLSAAAPGTYTILWAPLAGWRTPEQSSSIQLAATGSTIAFLGAYHTPSAVPGGDGSPVAALRLYPARPNPFNPRTTIAYSLPETGPLRLSVFDMAGRLVRTLVDENMPQGSHETVWDGRDMSGREVGSGSYLARLEFGGRMETVRLSLVR